jgi:hypothetical protein
LLPEVFWWKPVLQTISHNFQGVAPATGRLLWNMTFAVRNPRLSCKRPLLELYHLL